MGTHLINFAEDIEKERLDVKIEGFMVQEEFGYQAEILGIDFMFLSICFKDGQCPLPVDLFARWLPPGAVTLK